MGAITNKTRAKVHHSYFYTGEQNRFLRENQQLEREVGVWSPSNSLCLTQCRVSQGRTMVPAFLSWPLGHIWASANMPGES